jgi:C4-dicarboxylate-specific signal transduction histidine kinase
MAARTQQTVYLADLAAAERAFPAVAGDLRSAALGALAALPLRDAEELLGVLCLTFAEPQPFDAGQREFLAAVAEQAGQALARARLYVAEQWARTAAEVAQQETEEALEQLRASQAQLVQAGKLAAIGTLAAGVAHELNQPLMVIRGQTQILLANGDNPARRREKLARIERQTDKMMHVIDHLRTFGRASAAGVGVPVALNAVVSEALLLIGAQLQERDIALDLDLAEPAPVALADPNEIEQIVLNLLVNARDAVGRAGRLTIRTRHDGAEQRLTVSDSGPGIPEAVLGRLFEPFFTTKPVGQGTGLGLSVSREIARRWGGDLALANQPDGTGAVATLTLPAARPARRAPP